MGVNETALGTAIIRESPDGRYCGTAGMVSTVNVHGWNTAADQGADAVSKSPSSPKQDHKIAQELAPREPARGCGVVHVRACTLCKLRVQVVHCVGLANVNTSGGLGSLFSGPASCDPFVVVWLGRRRLGETSVLWGSRKPLWGPTKK